MEIKNLIKKALVSSCICFTLITAVYMLCMTIVTTGDDSPAIEAQRVLLFFIFSLLWAIAGAVRSIKAIPSPLGRALHYLICVFGFYTCFMLPVNMKPSAVLTGIIIFTLLYWIAIALKAFFASRLRKNREQIQKYEDQFKKKK